jgi:hypothetical protein
VYLDGFQEDVAVRGELWAAIKIRMKSEGTFEQSRQGTFGGGPAEMVIEILYGCSKEDKKQVNK